MLLRRPGARFEAPRAPAEIAEAVELFARNSGRTGSIKFATGPFGPNIWLVQLSLRPNDERMRLYQEGRAAEPPVETVWLQERNPLEGKPTGRFLPNGQLERHGPYRALDIYQMGASGVREFLERGNTESGRGEHRSLEEAVRKAFDDDQYNAVRFREQKKEENRHRTREDRRHRLGIPALPVGIDLRTPEGSDALSADMKNPPADNTNTESST